MKFWLAIILVLGLSAVAYASPDIAGKIGRSSTNYGFTGRMGITGGIGTGASPPPSCTNKLDFSVACNSMYIPTI